MKKLLKLAVLTSLAQSAFAGKTVYNGTLVNGPVASTFSFTLNVSTVPNENGMNAVSAQVIYSSVPLAIDNFNDGRAATGSFTVTNPAALLPTPATNQITVPTTQQILGSGATNQVTISSCVPKSLVYVNGYRFIEGIDWNCGGTTTTGAKSLAAAFNSVAGAVLTSTNVANVIWSTADVVGVSGNSYVMTTSSPPAYSTTSWSGGKDPALRNAIITFNGIGYRNGQLWSDGSGTSTGTAISITSMFQTFGVVTATCAAGTGSVVYASATVNGSAGNSFTLSDNAALLITASANFSGGNDAAVVTVGGYSFKAGVDFSTGTASATATSMAAAFNTKASSQIVTAQAVGAVVTSTADFVGTVGNYPLTSSTGAITTSGPLMTGGTNASWTVNQPVINLPGHGYATGLAVWLSSSGPIIQYSTATTGGTLTTLAQNTTYYVIAVDTNNVELALTSTGAVAGAYLTLKSSSTTGPHTYSLNPSTWTATGEVISWSVSNDCVNFTSLSATKYGITVPSTSVSSFTYPIATAVWDLGEVDYQCIRLNVGGPTNGEWNVKAIINGRD